MLSRSWLSAAFVCLLLGLPLVGQQPPSGAPVPQPARPPVLTPQETIAQALQRPVTLDVIEKPLVDLLEELGKQAGVRIQVHRKGLADAGLRGDEPITLALSNVPLKRVLKRALADLDLTYVVRNEALIVTTIDDANTTFMVKVWPVKDLVEPDFRAAGDETPPDLDSLIDLFTSSIEPTTWDDVGGPGSLAAHGNSLVCLQLGPVQERMEACLAILRRSRELWKGWDGKARAPALLGGGSSLQPDATPEDAKLVKALAEPTAWDKVETPLSVFLADLSRKHNIPIMAKKKVMADAGISLDTPITEQIENVSLAAALRRVLYDLGLVMSIREGVVLVTTPDDQEAFTWRAYPVFDLVEESFGPRPFQARPIVHGSSIPVVGSIERGPRDPLYQIGPVAGHSVPSSPLDSGSHSHADELMDLISGTIDATTWEDVGGPSSMDYYEPSRALILHCPQETHVKIESLLARLREVTPISRKLTQERLEEYDRKVIPAVYMLVAGKPELPAPEASEVADAIRAAVSPEMWKQPGNSLIALRGRVRVVAPRHTQRAVERLLRQLGVLAPTLWNPVLPGQPQAQGGQGGFGGGGFSM